MTRQPEFHGWRHAQRLVDPAEVVPGKVQRDRGLVAFYGFTVCIRPAGMPAEVHPDGQVTALYEGGIGTGQIRMALVDGLGKIRLLRHGGIIHFRAERFINGISIGRESIRRDLRPINDPAADVAQ